MWAQNNLCSLNTTHVPGKMNHGADMLSRNNVSSGEWMLHPLVVQKIWEVFGRARVDLFASEENSHCPIFFTKSKHALANEWPSLPLYAFPPIALLPQVLRRVREQWHRLILIAPLWRKQRRCQSYSSCLKQIRGWFPWDAFHAPIAGRSVGRDSAVVQFLQGARRMNPPRPRTVPHWDLPTVLRALKGRPFEPLQSTSLRALSLKTTLLLALTSVKRVGDLQALSINPACLEFRPNDSKVVLKPRLGYVSKVLSTPFQSPGHNAFRAPPLDG